MTPRHHFYSVFDRCYKKGQKIRLTGSKYGYTVIGKQGRNYIVNGPRGIEVVCPEQILLF